MYKCQICNTNVSANASAHRVVLETRARQYPFRPDVFLKPDPKKKGSKRKPRKPEYNDDPGGTGYETVREVIACAACARAGSATKNLRL
jgi:hypothetical protein